MSGWELLERWLAGCEPLHFIRDEASVSLVREDIRAQARGLGFSRKAQEQIAAAASELAHNHLRHARDGVVGLRPVQRDGIRGLEVVAADRGPGLESPAIALAGTGRRRGPGLGLGLAAASNLGDEMDLDVRLGEGTCVAVRKFLEPVRRIEVGCYGRHCPGESVSGDLAAVVRGEAGLAVALVDGAGHGESAYRSAALALSAFEADPFRAPDEILRGADELLRGQRGAAMVVVRVAGAEIFCAHVGDVAMRRWRERRVDLCEEQPGVLGKSPLRFRTHHADWRASDFLVLSTDGLSARMQIEEEPGHPILLAERLVKQYGRPHDDALVVVLRG